MLSGVLSANLQSHEQPTHLIDAIQHVLFTSASEQSSVMEAKDNIKRSCEAMDGNLASLILPVEGQCLASLARLLPKLDSSTSPKEVCIPDLYSLRSVQLQSVVQILVNARVEPPEMAVERKLETRLSGTVLIGCAVKRAMRQDIDV